MAQAGRVRERPIEIPYVLGEKVRVPFEKHNLGLKVVDLILDNLVGQFTHNGPKRLQKVDMLFGRESASNAGQVAPDGFALLEC
ncbi:MAG TPA: hypothetical protein VKV77_13355 [Methylovirgula sp.]|nr:hypothetical protein [Methylovirgula sp.]